MPNYPRVPFPFRFASTGSYMMHQVVNNGGGFVQYPYSGLPQAFGQAHQISLVSGSNFSDLQQGTQRKKSQSAVMGYISPNDAAGALGLGAGSWEWLHLVAFSIRETHVSSITVNSRNLIERTNQPQQIQENLVLGSVGANTAMLTYETMIKNTMRIRPSWKLDLFVAADIEQMDFNGRKIPVANRIDFHFQFRTEQDNVMPPVILAFNPKDPKAPTRQEFQNVTASLERFLNENPVNIPGFLGLGTEGYEQVKVVNKKRSAEDSMEGNKRQRRRY